jgi:hypothetical protein
VLRDTSSLSVATAFGIANLPVTFFISSDGKVVAETLGQETLSDLRAEAKRLLKASPNR